MQMKELDGYLPSKLEDLLPKNVENVTGVKLAGRNLDSEPLPISEKPSMVSTDIQEAEVISSLFHLILMVKHNIFFLLLLGLILNEKLL